MVYKIDLTLNKIWSMRAKDCNMKKKDISTVIKGIDFKNFNYKQFLSIHKRLKEYHKKNPKASSDATTDLWWFTHRFYERIRGDSSPSWAHSWIWKTSSLKDAWNEIRSNAK